MTTSIIILVGIYFLFGELIESIKDYFDLKTEIMQKEYDDRRFSPPENNYEDEEPTQPQESTPPVNPQ